MVFFRYIYLIFRNFLKNFRLLGKYDFSIFFQQRKRFVDYERVYQGVLQCKKQNICTYYAMHPSEAELFADELNFLNSIDFIDPFPYPTIKHCKNVQSGFDEKKHMAFVVHNGKKMYLPKGNHLCSRLRCISHLQRTFVYIPE